VIVHGETVTEPVMKGTNREAIECKADILSHPGLLTEEDAEFAKKNGVYIEITTRGGHSQTNRHVRDVTRTVDADVILNTDTHDPEDLIEDSAAKSFLRLLEFSDNEIERIFQNSKRLISKKIKRYIL
jgi:histidinol phosphatase-like PHP family hydrolase